MPIKIKAHIGVIYELWHVNLIINHPQKVLIKLKYGSLKRKCKSKIKNAFAPTISDKIN